MLQTVFRMLFGDGRNVVRDVAEVFTPNAEAASARDATYTAEALGQLASEFARPPRNWWDAFIDGLNRLPRPFMVFAIFYLLSLPVYNPVRAAEVFTSMALVPQPVWVLFGIVVTFFFGGRNQAYQLDFGRELATVAARLPGVVAQLEQIQQISHDTPLVGDPGDDADTVREIVAPEDNPAISAWRNGDQNG